MKICDKYYVIEQLVKGERFLVICEMVDEELRTQASEDGINLYMESGQQALAYGLMRDGKNWKMVEAPTVGENFIAWFDPETSLIYIDSDSEGEKDSLVSFLNTHPLTNLFT